MVKMKTEELVGIKNFQFDIMGMEADVEVSIYESKDNLWAVIDLIAYKRKPLEIGNYYRFFKGRGHIGLDQLIEDEALELYDKYGGGLDR